ncbi:hypothetical protein phi16_gp026 [Corynebacterium phage phi16]|uniref:hypothetical protein n=1 Tax=Corynebacterium glutamicum TaxID=1718 RepID=UPI0009423CF5|nr:hypothetical protein [Corynebacterium glutamicum]APQ42530.1 hypothetical protein phi16_gp026 [Corynebacterium phage phi16]OKX80476.1 hypothetical protein AUO95_09980 [Corynebacterium glutamicum]
MSTLQDIRKEILAGTEFNHSDDHDPNVSGVTIVDSFIAEVDDRIIDFWITEIETNENGDAEKIRVEMWEGEDLLGSRTLNPGGYGLDYLPKIAAKTASQWLADHLADEA